MRQTLVNIFFAGVVITLVWNSFVEQLETNSTLRLVHVLFRHGNRNPDQSNLWKFNPYYNESYYPEGYGQLTNKGKKAVYNLGKLLRKRYDTFLGKTWNINLLDVRSSDWDRTKMSVELMLAGLWPPENGNIWNAELPWQPIPYNYVPKLKDALLMIWLCPKFKPELQKALDVPDIASYLDDRYGETMRLLNDYSGTDVKDYVTAYHRYLGLIIQDQLNVPLENWTRHIYPEPIHSLAVDIYYLVTNTTSLRKLMAGTLIKKILTDTEHFIKGTLSPKARKMFIYSGHELNIASVLNSLEAFKLLDTPSYGSIVLFELHQIKDVYGFKLFYIDYTAKNSHGPLVIPGCFEFCPFYQFYSLVEEILPDSEEICFGKL